MSKPLKVKDIIRELKKMNPELEVVTSIDDEGNGFNKVYCHPSVGYYLDRDFLSEEQIEEDNEVMKTEGQKVVCLN